ncbi:MAG: hypothetical protein QMC96_08530 [Methanomicrobiales archaeon]|nr:hypothetical protein [Methanomicrobiales archaeon]
MKKESALKGLLFVTFLSLIVRMRPLKRMQETGLLEEYPLEGMLRELAKIKKVRLATGEILPTEVSKRQRMILDASGLCA